MVQGIVSAGITRLIGNTPLLRVRMFERDFPRVEVYAKAEWFNPGGSVKDRAALAMIEDGERRGALTHEKTIIDSTSGNTGIAYALVGAAKSYRVKLVMPGNVSAERKALVGAYGAEIVYSDPLEGSDGAILKVRELVSADPDRYFYPDQYSNPANVRAHFDGTAVEILEQTSGRLTHFVAGLGTTGTFVGTARGLKEFNQNVRAISFQPDSPIHGLEGMKHLPTAIVPGIYDDSVADGLMTVATEDAQAMTRRLAREEGIFVGPSSGANVLAALEAARKSTGDAVVVTILCDGGGKYLGESFWNE
jgi:cysteine synthase B